MSSEELSNDAQYGCLPFDIFALEHWDYDAPATSADDKQQWDRLTREYLNLRLPDRHTYYHRTCVDPLQPTPDQISRVLAPHQTVHERNISIGFCQRWEPLWVRICYDPDLQEKYQNLADAAAVTCETSILPGFALDDATLYDFEDGTDEAWKKIFARLPGWTDGMGVVDRSGDGSFLMYGSRLNDPEALATVEAKKDEGEKRRAAAELQIQNIIYVADREAIERGIVKVMWINEHGEAAWDNKIDPEDTDMDGLLGALWDGQRFVELVDTVRGSFISR